MPDTATALEWISKGFAVAPIQPFCEPHVKDANYSTDFTWGVPAGCNLAVRRKDCVAIRYEEQFGLCLELLNNTGSLLIKAGRVTIAAFRIREGIDLVTDGLIQSGPLFGSSVVTTGFLVEGRVFDGASIVKVVATGELAAMPDDIRKALKTCGRLSEVNA